MTPLEGVGAKMTRVRGGLGNPNWGGHTWGIPFNIGGLSEVVGAKKSLGRTL